MRNIEIGKGDCKDQRKETRMFLDEKMSCLGTQQQDLFTDDQDFRHVFVLIVQKLVFVSERGRFHQVLNLGGIVKEVNP